MQQPGIKIFFIVFIFVMMLLSSCREEIIPPGNPAGNINEPVLESYLDYYTFKINASNLTFTLTDLTNFNSPKNILSFALIDYNSGSVDVVITNKINQTVYNTSFIEDKKETTVVLDGHIPEYIQIRLDDFSGKMSIRLNKY